MKLVIGLLAGLGVVSSLIIGTGHAQEATDAAATGSVPAATIAPAQIPLEGQAASSGPKVYLTDRTGQIGVLDIGTHAVTLKGNRGTVLSDLAFCPDGKLYGVTFLALYAVNGSNGTRTRIGGGFGNLGINALVCNASGTLLAGSYLNRKLYRLNKSTGTATALSGTAPKSDGDLVYHEQGLFLSTADDKLAKLAKSTGAILSSKAHGITDLFGLVSFGTDRLYGFAGTKVYKFTENASGPTGGRTLQFDFANKGLQQIFGATYNGNFQS